MARLAICLMLASTVGCHATSPSATEAPAVPSVTAAATPAGQADPPSIIGVWRGTSQCTVRPSPCNDEVVVYHFSAGAGRDDIVLAANKLVDGQEQEMGTLHCQLQQASHRLECKIEKGTFVYAIDKGRMHGTLDLLDGTRYRVIEVERSSGP